jgi:exodeoxyribonuclease V beta subunit
LKPALESPKTPRFDLLRSPLQGTNLIEAGAGTGKTYTITGLFLRLILERRLPVNEILVVTYTVAATEELRDRIRRKIREALEACSAGTCPDSFLQGLIGQAPDREEATGLLRAALLDFDEAAIFTIHGFCQRILQENAFESGSLFDTKLEPEQETGLIREIVQDFWRRHFYDAPREWVQYALSKNLGPVFFLDLLSKGRSHPDLKIVPETAPVVFTALEPFRRAYGVLQAAWPAAREEVERAFSDPTLYADYGKQLTETVGRMDAYLAENGPVFPLPEKFEKFTTGVLEKKTRKKMETPRHPFFQRCDELHQAAERLREEMDRHLLFLKGEIFQTLRRELPLRKQRRNIQSFDDLLTRLRRSLEKAGGDELSAAVRNRYRAALIDEFQDTDPVQYAIFQHIFVKSGAILFLIGDPKQAIYSFRGADLFAYLKAAGRVDCRYTLDRNWRSEPGLITAVNTVFGRRENPFLYPEIPFEPATAKVGAQPAGLSIRGKTEPPLTFWLVDSDETGEGGLINKGEAEALISVGLAGEISRLLRLGEKGEALIGGRPLREGDLAILVRTNRQARLVQEALGGLNMLSVLHTTGNLFDSYEALELQRLLEGIVHPSREGGIRAALTTNLLGVNGETLERLTRDEAGWEEWLSRFRDYGELGERKGFIGMFQYFLLREKVRSRLLSLPGGERRLTNVLHLAEVLHQVAVDEKLSLSGLIKWLARQRDPGSPRLEEHQLRLESDAEAVKIVTIHKSKGLEYPIVFCPFNWNQSRIKNGVFSFHDREDDWRLNLVLDPEAKSLRELAEQEELAENLRLLYVALTRAKNRAYLVWGRFRDAETSSLAYLLSPSGNPAANIVSQAGRFFQSLTDEKLRQELEGLAGNSADTIRVVDLPRASGRELGPAGKEPEELIGRVFREPVPRDWQMASFSRLTAGVQESGLFPEAASADLPDHDQALTAEEPVFDPDPRSIFAFPRGAKAGTLLHAIFENLDFIEKDPAIVTKGVAARLEEYGFDPEWQGTIGGLIGRVLAAPLPACSGDFTLAQIPRGQRLNELGFHFPLRRITPQGLGKIFADHGGSRLPVDFPARLEKLDFQPARGFMKGFLDLVFQFQGRFYVVDWKSNFLGGRVEDYHRENLARAMEGHFYTLQLTLYVLALHRYLKIRVPGYCFADHFGGAYYLFLRGIDPEVGKGFGIYAESPGEELIEALSRGLIGTEADG